MLKLRYALTSEERRIFQMHSSFVRVSSLGHIAICHNTFSNFRVALAQMCLFEEHARKFCHAKEERCMNIRELQISLDKKCIFDDIHAYFSLKFSDISD